MRFFGRIDTVKVCNLAGQLTLVEAIATASGFGGTPTTPFADPSPENGVVQEVDNVLVSEFPADAPETASTAVQ